MKSTIFPSIGFRRNFYNKEAWLQKHGGDEDVNNVVNCYSNISSTHRLIQALPPSIQRFVFLSSVDVYAFDNYALSESSAVDPSSLYGHSKYYCEKALDTWANETNKIIQVLRIGHVFGPGEEAFQKIIPVSIKKLINGEAPQIWGKGEELRSFIYIDDVVRMILATLKLDVFVGPVNIVSENTVSIDQLVKLIINICGLNIFPQYLPSSLVTRDLAFANAKMKNIFGPEQTTLQYGLKTEWNYMNNLKNQ